MFSGDGLHFVWHRIVFTEESCTGMAVPEQQRLVDRWFLNPLVALEFRAGIAEPDEIESDR